MTADAPPFRALSLFDDAAVPVAGGSLSWVPVRRRLGIGAFGVNAYRAARSGDTVVEEHVESPGQEELYVVVRGRARLVVGDETIDAPAGSAVFVPDPGARRAGHRAGGRHGRPGRRRVARASRTTRLPWEPIYLAAEAMRTGDWAAAAETLEREAGEHADTAIIRFRLACLPRTARRGRPRPRRAAAGDRDQPRRCASAPPRTSTSRRCWTGPPSAGRAGRSGWCGRLRRRAPDSGRRPGRRGRRAPTAARARARPRPPPPGTAARRT